jgi:hypothetical protein
MKKLVSCIGTGNMGGALMKAAASVVGGAEILVTDWDASKAAAFAAEIGASVASSNAEAADGRPLRVLGGEAPGSRRRRGVHRPGRGRPHRRGGRARPGLHRRRRLDRGHPAELSAGDPKAEPVR